MKIANIMPVNWLRLLINSMTGPYVFSIEDNAPGEARRGCSVDRKEIEYREKIKTPDK